MTSSGVNLHKVILLGWPNGNTGSPTHPLHTSLQTSGLFSFRPLSKIMTWHDTKFLVGNKTCHLTWDDMIFCGWKYSQMNFSSLKVTMASNVGYHAILCGLTWLFWVGNIGNWFFLGMQGHPMWVLEVGNVLNEFFLLQKKTSNLTLL